LRGGEALMVGRLNGGAGDRAGALLALAAAIAGCAGVAAFALAPAEQQSFAPTLEFLGSVAASGFLQALAIGTWLGVAALLGRRRAVFPLSLTVLGVAAAAAFLFAAALAASGTPGGPNLALTLLVAGVVIPAWFLGLALVLWWSTMNEPAEPRSA
jgi:hypothetical protein